MFLSRGVAPTRKPLQDKALLQLRSDKWYITNLILVMMNRTEQQMRLECNNEYILKNNRGVISHATRDHLHGNKYADVLPCDVLSYRDGQKQHADTYVTCLW